MTAAFYKKQLMLNFYSSNGISGYRYSHVGVCGFALPAVEQYLLFPENKPSTNTGGGGKHNYEYPMNYAIGFMEILVTFGNELGLSMVA